MALVGGAGAAMIVFPSSAAASPLPLAVVDVFLTTSPANLTILVDNISAPSPQTYAWANGSDHLVAVESPQTFGSTRYVFSDWSDGGSLLHLFHVDNATTLVARFSTEFLANISTSPLALEMTVDNAIISSPAEFWWAEGSTHAIQPIEVNYPTPDVEYAGFAWTDGGAVRRTFVVVGPLQFLGVYRTTFYLLTLEAPPAAGATCSYTSCWYPSGDTARFSFAAPPESATSTREHYGGWTATPGNGSVDPSTAGAILMDGPNHITAVWSTQHYLAIDAGVGRASGWGWYDEGQNASVMLDSVEVSAGGQTWRFEGWTGAVTSTASQVALQMDGPKTLTATWRIAPTGAQAPTQAGAILIGVVIAAIAGGAVASTRRGEYALGALLVPLFTRMQRDEVRNQFTRGRILQFIEDHPGTGYGHLRRRLALSNGACAYHLRVLERNSDIRRVVEGSAVRFYTAGYKFDAEALPPLAYFQRRILEEIIEAGSVDFKQLSQSLASRGEAVTATNLGYHLTVLAREKHLIETRRKGRKTIYYLEGERREALRARLKAEYGVDEAMDAAALSRSAVRVGEGREPASGGEPAGTTKSNTPSGERSPDGREGI